MLQKLLICSLILCFNLNFASAQNKRSSAKLEAKEIKLDQFSAIRVDGVFNVYLQKAQAESLIIETNNDYHELINAEVRSGVLVIDMEKTRRMKVKKFNLYINYVNLNTIELDIIGNLTADDELASEQLDIILEGVGNTDLNLDCDKLDVEIKRIGNVEMTGRAADVNIDSRCTGNVSCRNLRAQNLRLRNKSVGNVSVHAEETLDIDSSGVGNVSYSGNAKIVNLDSSGVGKVRKL